VRVTISRMSLGNVPIKRETEMTEFQAWWAALNCELVDAGQPEALYGVARILYAPTPAVAAMLIEKARKEEAGH
jgi:hypothetical protein